jgi:hypothetical protein
MYPETRAVPGSYLHAYISTDGVYCNNPKAADISKEGNTETGKSFRSPTDQDSLFRIYPNPNNGRFTLELSAEPGEKPVSVKCYDRLGSLIMEEVYHTGKKHQLSLEGHASGLYLIRVIMNDETNIRKVVKQ